VLDEIDDEDFDDFDDKEGTPTVAHEQRALLT
jgi:hypothetical protein